MTEFECDNGLQVLEKALGRVNGYKDSQRSYIYQRLRWWPSKAFIKACEMLADSSRQLATVGDFLRIQVQLRERGLFQEGGSTTENVMGCANCYSGVVYWERKTEMVDGHDYRVAACTCPAGAKYPILPRRNATEQRGDFLRWLPTHPGNERGKSQEQILDNTLDTDDLLNVPVDYQTATEQRMDDANDDNIPDRPMGNDSSVPEYGADNDDTNLPF